MNKRSEQMFQIEIHVRVSVCVCVRARVSAGAVYFMMPTTVKTGRILSTLTQASKGSVLLP